MQKSAQSARTMAGKPTVSQPQSGAKSLLAIHFCEPLNSLNCNWREPSEASDGAAERAWWWRWICRGILATTSHLDTRWLIIPFWIAPVGVYED